MRRQYLFVEAIQECEENELEDIEPDPEDLQFDEWINQANEDLPLEEDPEQEVLVNATHYDSRTC